MRRTRGYLVGAVAVLAAALPGCGRGDQRPVLTLVAASTKDAVEEAAKTFAAEQQAEVKVVPDASSKLANQIVNDAPADLFLSASEDWGDFVKQKGYATDMTLLLGNALVLVVPKGNPARVTRPQDLTGPAVKRLALAGPKVPAGVYARQALKHLKLWEVLEAGKKVVPGDDVRVTLSYVERGEADAGIVYATDARVSDGVEQVYEFPASTHDAIRYPLVLLKGGESNPAARAFYDFLCGPRAAEVFRKHGFTPLAAK